MLAEQNQQGPQGESYGGRVKYTDAAADRYRNKSEKRRGPENRILPELLERHEIRGPLLDSPCGVGRVAGLLQDFEIDYTGSDLSPSMLNAAKERIASFEAPKIATKLARVDAEQLPYGDQSFGTVLSMRFLHHLPSKTRAHVMRELARVSSRMIIVTYFSPFALHYLDRQVRHALKGSKSGRYSNSVKWFEQALRGTEFELVEEVGTGFLRETRYAVFRRRSSTSK